MRAKRGKGRGERNRSSGQGVSLKTNQGNNKKKRKLETGFSFYQLILDFIPFFIFSTFLSNSIFS